LRRSSPTESPNFFWTTDFKTFSQLSAIHPEKKYNWLTSELHTFGTLDGRTEHGILYKPEDFDPGKRYPVIFNYYEQRSDELYQFPDIQDPNGGNISIPWFVSRGYLVFIPDIHYAMGANGPCAYNSIVGAAKYLSRFPWVDSKRMGIEGHSFGGYETIYVATRTDLFAAAIASSGPVNLVSEYGQLWGENNSKQDYYENRQGRMGGTLWQKPDAYIKTSPIFNLDKITIPILSVANKRDANVKFSHGLELFLGLRRLGKRAWMLQYDDGSHGVRGKDYVDLTIRMTQFFDHYLKGGPAPKWMTEGMPARLKGIEIGLELDMTGKSPGPGLLKDEPEVRNTHKPDHKK
jgi:dipeptidyl aminopeptidase/acylaminoacyl peptidase